MSCLDANLVAVYLDGTLSPDDRSRVETHVDGCAECRHVLAQWSRTFVAPPGGDAWQDDGSAAGPPLVGHRMGRYVVLEWLGAGGMGVVYSAYDTELDRKVAIKVLARSGPAGETIGREHGRLVREAKALARVVHPNVVSVFDVGSHGGDTFVAMEFVEGGTLADWLAEGGRSWRAILDVCIAAGRGLAAVHAANLVHRDFKPANVLVGADGRVRVSDFGLTTDAAGDAAPDGATETETETEVVAGTPAYMAPEQRRGVATAQTDQYAFCAVLHEALSGERSVPSWLRATVARGLRAEPSERHPSMDALLAALTRDRKRAWARWAIAAAAVGALALSGAAYLRAATTGADACRGAEKKLAGVWDDERRQGIARAFSATDKPYAADAVRGVESALDSYTHDWVSMHTEACQATRRGEQSAELLDLRMACLGDRLKEVAALVDVLQHADSSVVTNAIGATHALTSLTRCGDVDSLRSRVQPPPNSEVAAKVDGLRQELAHVKALDDAAKYKEAVPLAQHVVEAARALGYPRLEGEALFHYGWSQMQAGDSSAGQQTLFEAAWTADAAGDDYTRVTAWSALLQQAGKMGAKPETAQVLRGQGTAAARRLGSDDEAQGLFLHGLAAELRAEGNLGEARAAEERALELRKKVFGDASVEVAEALWDLGTIYRMQGDEDAALDRYNTALAIERNVLGPSHPYVATLDFGIGTIYEGRLQLAEAQASYERALGTAEAALGPDHPWVAHVVAGLGENLAEQGQYTRAVELDRRALAMQEKALQPGSPLLLLPLRCLGEALYGLREYAESIAILERAQGIEYPGYPVEAARARFALARALSAAGRDPRRARELAVGARDTYEKSAESAMEKRDLERVRAWLAEHP